MTIDLESPAVAVAQWLVILSRSRRDWRCSPTRSLPHSLVDRLDGSFLCQPGERTEASRVHLSLDAPSTGEMVQAHEGSRRGPVSERETTRNDQVACVR
jgi:hypothetical protein